MSDRIEEIQRGVHHYETARDDSHAKRTLPATLVCHMPYLIALVRAAERYIAADRAFDAAVLDKDWLIARADRDAAMKDWEAAKGAP